MLGSFLVEIPLRAVGLKIFQLKSGLGLKNILHIAEICIVVLLSNAESEQIFSYLWHQLSKEWMSLNHQTFERILQLRSAGKDYCIETYDHAIDLFLTEFPNGTVRKRPRHVDVILLQSSQLKYQSQYSF